MLLNRTTATTVSARATTKAIATGRWIVLNARVVRVPGDDRRVIDGQPRTSTLR
jgi:hypothetical protein